MAATTVSNDAMITYEIFPVAETSYLLHVVHHKATKDVVATEAEVTKNEKVLHLFVLDVSGSMRSVIRPLTTIVLEKMSQLLSNSANRVGCILYSTNACTYLFNTLNEFAQFKSIIASDATTGGNTSFGSALRAINEVVSQPINIKDIAFIRVLFLTDGDETVEPHRPEAIQAAREQLKASLDQIKMVPSVVDAYGFTHNHDARFIGTLTEIGNVQGTFTFIRTTSELLAQFKESETDFKIAASSYCKSSNDFLIRGFHLNELKLSVYAGHNATDDFWYLVPSTITKTECTIINQSSSFTHELDLTRNHVIEWSVVAIRAFLAITASRYANALRNTKDGLVLLQQYDNELTFLLSLNCIKKSFAIRKAIRTDITSAKEVLSDLIIQFARNVHQNGTISNGLLASLQQKVSDELYRQGTLLSRKSVQKKIEIRRTEGLERLQSLDERIDAVHCELMLQKDVLQTQLNALHEMTCIFTQLSPFELLEEKDCIGLALSIARPEAAVLEPSRLIIKEVLPSFISARSFLECVDHKEFTAGGAFDKSTGTGYTVGIARESINGILLLHLNKDNWKLANVLAEPVYGQMFTLDILQYTPSMKYTLPFLVLEHLLFKKNAQQSEFIRDRLQYVMELCQMYCRKELLEEFMSSIDNRLPDIVPSISIMMGHLYTLKSITSAEKCTLPNDFVQMVLTEALRRDLNHMSLTDLKTAQQLMIGQDHKQLFCDHLKAFEERLFNEEDVETASSFAIPVCPEEIVNRYTLREITIETKTLFDYRKTKRWLNIIRGIALDPIPNVLLVAMYVQALESRETAVARTYPYVIFHTEQQALEWLRTRAQNWLRTEWTRGHQVLIDRQKTSMKERNANLFLRTSSIEVAMRCVNGLNHGHNLRCFWTPFKYSTQTAKIPLRYEKMTILMTGHFNGIRCMYEGNRSDSKAIMNGGYWSRMSYRNRRDFGNALKGSEKMDGTLVTEEDLQKIGL